MYRLIIALVVLIASAGITAISAQGSASRQPTLSVAAEGTSYSVGNNGGDIWLAQSFRGIQGTLVEFSVTLAENSGFPMGAIAWQLRANVQDVPSEEILVQGEFTPIENDENVIRVKDGPAFSTSETYWLLLKTGESQYDQDYWGWQVSPVDVYPDGRLLYTGNAGYGWHDDGVDAQFSITVDDDLASR